MAMGRGKMGEITYDGSNHTNTREHRSFDKISCMLTVMMSEVLKAVYHWYP